MKPLIFRVRPGSNYDLNDSDQLYVVDFLLDCTTAWVAIRDTVSIFDSQKDKSQLVLNKLALLLYSITTDPSHRVQMKIKVEPLRILALMADQLGSFSASERERILQIIKYNLKEYL